MTDVVTAAAYRTSEPAVSVVDIRASYPSSSIIGHTYEVPPRLPTEKDEARVRLLLLRARAMARSNQYPLHAGSEARTPDESTLLGLYVLQVQDMPRGDETPDSA